MDNNKYVIENKSFSGTDMVAMLQMVGPNGEQINYTLGSMQTLTYSIHMDRRPIRSIGNINAKDYVMGPRTIAGSLIFAVFNKHFAYEVMEDIRKEYNPRYTFLADEFPPFNITISFANEYGAQSKLVLYGVRLVNEGQVMSVNDIYTENTYQFVATDIEYLTDVNGYASSMHDKNNIIISKEDTLTDSNIGKEIRDKIKNPSLDKHHTKIELIPESITPQIGDKNGTVRFTLSPFQESGTIIVKGTSLLSNIEIDVSEHKNQPIYLLLPANKYTVQYKDIENDKSSNEKQFMIGKTSLEVSNTKPAPLIEYVSDKKISIYSNVASHSKLMYAVDPIKGDPSFNEITLKSRRATIDGLLPNTKYVFYTCNNTSMSLKTYATTEEFFAKHYEDIKLFVTYNHSLLKHNILGDYITIIDQAKAIAINSKNSITPSTAIADYKDSKHREKTMININDYRSYDEYLFIINKIENEIIMCKELLIIANRLENDEISSLNPSEVAIVKPPVPELIDAINCVFIFGPEVERLEFYRQYSHIAQFAIEIDKISFFNYTNGRYGFKYHGKPGVNHYVYAYDKRGHRSARFNFYVMTDEEKEVELKAYNEQNNKILKTFTDKEQEIGAELIKMDLIPESRKRILLEETKIPDIFILPAPIITEIQKDKVMVDVSYKESLDQYIKDFYVVITPIDDALFNRSAYKKRLDSNIVEFTTRYGGVRPDMQYAVWIENDNGEQISYCSTFATYSNITDETVQEESKLKIRENTEILNKIKDALSHKVTISDEINSSIENLKEDLTIEWNNIFDKIAQNFMNHISRVVNIDQLIRSLYEVKIDILHCTDLMFFSNVSYDSKNNSIKFSSRSEDFMITVHSISQNNSNIITYRAFANQENSIVINKSLRYVMIYAVAQDIYTKSGIIIIDTVTNKVSGYKIKIGG